MRVLGIDPGTAALGFGIVEGRWPAGVRLVECGVIRTKASDRLPARLRQLHDGVAELIAFYQPDCVAIETAFHGKNVRTTLVLGHARGVVLLAAETAGATIAEYEPRLVKKAVVGKGGALKQQMGYMVAHLLKLKSAPRPEDAADAVGVALAHILLHGQLRSRTGRSGKSESHRTGGSSASDRIGSTAPSGVPDSPDLSASPARPDMIAPHRVLP